MSLSVTLMSVFTCDLCGATALVSHTLDRMRSRAIRADINGIPDQWIEDTDPGCELIHNCSGCSREDPQ